MKVVVEPLDSFIHGEYNTRKGVDTLMDNATALDLERGGLVRIKGAAAPLQTQQQLSDLKSAAGKAPSDGPGQPSLLSPVAPALPTKIVKPSATGGTKSPAKGKS